MKKTICLLLTALLLCALLGSCGKKTISEVDLTLTVGGTAVQRGPGLPPGHLGGAPGGKGHPHPALKAKRSPAPLGAGAFSYRSSMPMRAMPMTMSPIMP